MNEKPEETRKITLTLTSREHLRLLTLLGAHSEGAVAAGLQKEFRIDVLGLRGRLIAAWVAALGVPA